MTPNQPSPREALIAAIEATLGRVKIVTDREADAILSALEQAGLKALGREVSLKILGEINDLEQAKEINDRLVLAHAHGCGAKPRTADDCLITVAYQHIWDAA